MENKSTLTFLVGPPGSGKTTYAEKHLKNENTVVLSSDEIRAEILGDANDQSNPEIIFATLYARAKKNLKDGKNVVLDSTNTNKKYREIALQEFSDMDIVRQAIIFETSKKQCIARDKQRDRVVGKEIIERYFKYRSLPTKEEGFDKIERIK